MCLARVPTNGTVRYGAGLRRGNSSYILDMITIHCFCLPWDPHLWAGRNFEYISGEDPYLGWAMVQPLVAGIQSNNVVANAKHWVMNNQESNRHGDTAVVDERTRFELYYPPFAGAVQAGVGSIMCSYNLIQAVCVCACACVRVVCV